MNAVSNSKPMIFLVISVLVVALIYSSISTSGVFAAPKDPNFGGNCTKSKPGDITIEKCCWTEKAGVKGLSTLKYCQSCYSDVGGTWCDDKVLQGPPLQPNIPTGDLPQLETVPPIRTLPGGGDLPTLEQVPQEVPTCPEGQELDEETNLCVPVESQGVEQPEGQQLEPEEEPEEEQQQPEEEQSSEESDSGDESNN